jgi:prepilin peptidase CpaA
MNLYLYSVVLIQLLLISWIDLKTKRIYHLWPIFNFFLGLGLLVGGVHPLAYQHFYFPLGMLIIGFIFFLFRIMGGGDSKYLASLFFITPFEYHYLLFEKLVLVTMIVGSLLLMMTVVRQGARIKAYFVGMYWQGFKDIIKSRFSYAPVILIAWLYLGVHEWF